MPRRPPVRERAGGVRAAPARGSRASGFALIEVLVSFVILTVGLLGMAGLHSIAIAMGGSSLLRSKATEMGYEMGDRIRANPSGVTAYLANMTSTSPSDPGCITSGCTPTQLAQYDYWEWNRELANVLPAGSGVVCIDSTPDDGTPAAPQCDGIGSVLVVKVFWQEKGKPVPSYFATPVRP